MNITIAAVMLTVVAVALAFVGVAVGNIAIMVAGLPAAFAVIAIVMWGEAKERRSS